MAQTSVPVPSASGGGFIGRILEGIETVGNKVPHPAIIFLGLVVIVILLSHVLYLFDVDVTYDVAEPAPVEGAITYHGGSGEPEINFPPDFVNQEDYHIAQETTSVKSLLNGDGIRFMLTGAVDNFNNFGVVGVILVAMLGVGVAEEAGLIAALIRKLVAVSPSWGLSFIIILVGGLSSVASDAGYLVLIPLGAAAFLSVGRNPIAGIAAAYAGVSVGFSVNLLITPVDGIVTQVATEAAQLVEPGRNIGITSNLYFASASTVFVALIATIVTERLVEPRLGRFDGEAAATESVEVEPAAESRGLRYALVAFVVAIGAILLLTLPSGAPLRNPENGDLIGDSPFMDSLLFLISLIFLVAGLGYGRGAGTMKSSVDVINAITKTFSGLAGLIFLLLIIAQFIAFFNYTGMATVAAVKLADVLENADVGALWLLLGFILVTFVIDFIMPGVIPKWAIFAPIFVPLFLRLGVSPATALAAYRVGDSPANVVTPLMVYLPFIVLVAQRYKPESGVGTIISLMIPYTIVVLVTWMVLFAVWYLVGIPLGPGYPVKL